MRTHIKSLSIAALVLFVGTPVSAQVVEINDGETLTQDDLLAGSFLGQPFTLGPGLTLEINSGGLMGPINPADPFLPRRGVGEIDFAGSHVRVTGGGTYLEGFGPLDVSNLRLTLEEGGALPGGLVLRGGSDVRIQGGESMWPILLYGEDDIEVTGGRLDTIALLGGGGARLAGGVRSGVRAIGGSTVEFVGGDFAINGDPAAPGAGSIETGDALAGVHPDGSVFIEDGGRPDPNFSSNLPVFALTEAALPPARTEPYTVPAEPAPFGGLRPGQSLTLSEGGSLRDDFHVLGASLTVDGGEVGRSLRAMNARVTVAGGALNNASFYDGTEVSISGGAFAFAVRAFRTQSILIEGGEMSRGGLSLLDSNADIRGGLFDSIFANGASRLDVSGGELTDSISLWGESSLALRGGTMRGVLAIQNASVEFFGVDAVSFVGVDGDATFRMLSGTLPGKLFGDGSFEIHGGSVEGTLTLEPGAQCVVLDGSVGDGTEVRDGAHLVLQGGSVGAGLNAFGEARIVQTGGHLGENAVLLASSSLLISGGTVGDRVRLLGDNSSAELVVRSLTIDGAPVPIAPGERLAIEQRDVTLGAVLADGAPIGFFLNTDLFAEDLDYFSPNATLTAVGAPLVPCSAADLVEPFATLDLADLVAFVGAFLAQSDTADLNQDGVLDLDDVSSFVDAFGAGCGS